MNYLHKKYFTVCAQLHPIVLNWPMVITLGTWMVGEYTAMVKPIVT